MGDNELSASRHPQEEVITNFHWLVQCSFWLSSLSCFSRRDLESGQRGKSVLLPHAKIDSTNTGNLSHPVIIPVMRCEFLTFLRQVMQIKHRPQNAHSRVRQQQDHGAMAPPTLSAGQRSAEEQPLQRAELAARWEETILRRSETGLPLFT